MAKSEPITKPKRGRRSKADIQQEFENLVNETSEIQSYSNEKMEELSQLQDLQVRETVKEISADVIVRKLGELSIDISKTLSNLSEKMINEINLLTSLRQAVILEKKEMERLHKIDIAQTAIDQMIEDYNTQKETLESEIESMRSEWELEQEIKSREEKEYQDLSKKTRQRELEDFEYKKSQQRKKDQDKYEEDIRLKEKQVKETQEALEKNWQQREVSLKAQEEEYLNLQKIVEEYPARLKKEIDKATADAARQAEQKFTQEILLLKRDSESEKRIGELKIKGLEDTLKRQQEQLSSLQGQLEEAKKQVQDIAVKAIEGASGAKALSHINQIAMEQAKTRSSPS